METVKDISSLKIKGANFQEETILKLFDKKKVSLIYGENGAGKSTIAKGIYNLTKKDGSHEIQAAFLDVNGNDINVEDPSNHIFVFDEDYIQRMVGIKSSTGLNTTGLNTIVILGELKDVEEEIDKQKLALNKEKVIWQQEQNKLNELKNAENHESELFIKNRILEKLREDGGWADRLGKIRNNKTKSRVYDSTINDINSHQEFLQDMPEYIKNKNEEKNKWIYNWLQEHIELFSSIFELYQNTSNDASPISEEINLKQDPFDEAAFVDAMMKVVEKPKITERDELILSITATLQKKGVDFIKNVKDDFEQDGVERCPYCQQEIAPQRKEELLKAISKVLDIQTKNHISNQLSRFRINDIPNVEWKNFVSLNKAELVENCKNSLEALKGRVLFVHDLLNKKTNNPYQSITLKFEEVGLTAAYASAMKNVEVLNKAVTAYNKAINEHKDLRKKLEYLNNNIGFWEIYQLNEAKKTANKICSKQQGVVSELYGKVIAIQKGISLLEEKKKQVKIAVDEINASLAYIFLSADRLKIEYDSLKNEYRIKVNQMDVKPEEVSVGERNAIALSYFFSDIKKEKEQKNFYQGEYLLVIDDPISSFDKENRIGVVSFLRQELTKFEVGNPNTKIIIMTHDMQVFFDLYRIFDRVSKEGRKLGKESYMLDNKVLTTFNVRKFNEYSFLLQQIYSFAKGQSCGELNFEIGNMLRRVMEAYGTFLYKKGGANLFNEETIINIIENPKRRAFFKNFMIRLFLNGESHFEETVQVFNDMNFFSTLTVEKKQEYARCVLCFLYILNKEHILAHLEAKEKNIEWSKGKIEEQLNEWLQNIDRIAEVSCK